MPGKASIKLSLHGMPSPNGSGIYVPPKSAEESTAVGHVICRFAERPFFDGLDVLNKLHNQVGLGVEDQNNLQ